MGVREGVFSVVAHIEKRPGIIVHTVALFFLISGYFYTLYLGPDLRFTDEYQYFTLATNLVEGRGYILEGDTPTALRTPGYPLFLSIFIRLGASPVFLRYLNFIALTLCLYISYAILRREGAESGVVVSSLFFVAYGALYYTAGTLYPQTIFALVLILIVWLSIEENQSYLRAVTFGLLSALLIMLHPSAIFIPPLVVLWMYFSSKQYVVWKAVISALVVIACFSPWIYRNGKTFNAFIPFTTLGSYTLYCGNNPDTDINAWFDSVTEEVGERVYSLDSEVERHRFFLRETLSFWKEQPVNAVKLYILKLLNHFHFKNKLYIESEYDLLESIIMFVTYYPLLIGLIVRLCFMHKVRLSRVEVLFILLYSVCALFHAVFIPRIRFRLPYDMLLITHIGIISSLMLKMRRRA